ncbi:hypothetical protein OHS33_19665 [Streptomyces sp. NBC_00536]|uniref:hypothetical protein n=1 Tax=Streptomyces sp. NBC_00536 TaxID=2975769 RepID=UPI002E80D4A8|nr:hypothetical protein [Streptomyces sp. NBC_00536]WUC80343.1 hypothetical protein OHS33_19665 [Streptomyces sp. NBC_00536]
MTDTTATETLTAETAEAAPETANPFAAPDPTGVPVPPAAPRDRRALFAALRWTAAVLVFAVAAAGTAYAVIKPERTEIPGLATKSDGRWAYPAIAKPVLPPGAPLPFAADNTEGIHYAALSQLLLPAPEGSKPDESLKADKDGMVTQDRFLEEYSEKFREQLRKGLREDSGLRQIAGRGWTTSDGTATRVYLLRFHSAGFVGNFDGCKSGMTLQGADSFDLDSAWDKAQNGQATAGRMEHATVTTYAEEKPYGPEQTKVGCVQAGDLLGVVIQTHKGTIADVPFHQTVILQDQLLE